MLAQHAVVLVIAAGLATGCAEQLDLLKRGVEGARVPAIFWPPPPATSVWSASTDRATFGEVATQVTRTLDDAGYADARWYPIGVDFAHGFAVATRLERIESDGSPAHDRWCSLYPEASNLRWLEGARDPRLPNAGRFRVFLFAFTDLPAEPTNRAPRWNEETLMDAPDRTVTHFPADRRAGPRFRLNAFVYEYAAASADNRGEFIANDALLPAASQVRAARLGPSARRALRRRMRSTAPRRQGSCNRSM